jgi:hypothetical protein
VRSGLDVAVGAGAGGVVVLRSEEVSVNPQKRARPTEGRTRKGRNKKGKSQRTSTNQSTLVLSASSKGVNLKSGRYFRSLALLAVFLYCPSALEESHCERTGAVSAAFHCSPRCRPAHTSTEKLAREAEQRTEGDENAR